jgi:hypothetical protein
MGSIVEKPDVTRVTDPRPIELGELLEAIKSETDRNPALLKAPLFWGNMGEMPVVVNRLFVSSFTTAAAELFVCSADLKSCIQLGHKP